MNRTKIEWTDYTWNPVTGCLSTDTQCAVRMYCYARRTAKRLAGRCGYPPSPNEFKPTFHPERLEEPYRIKKPSKIFVCSMGELFGSWVSREWQEAVFKVASDNSQHTFQFLTKFPEGYTHFWRWPDNVWLGATLNSDEDWQRWNYLVEVNARVIFISAEPLLGPLGEDVDFEDLGWLIIGGQTNPERQPEKSWLETLLKEVDRVKVPVFMKDNLDYPEPKRREWPRGG